MSTTHRRLTAVKRTSVRTLVKPEITSPEDLAGTTLSSPQLGNTQDVSRCGPGWPTSEDRPDVVAAFLRGHLDSLERIAGDSEGAQTVTNDGLERLTTKRLDDAVLESAWANLEFTADPIASSLLGSKNAAVEVGLLGPVELDGIYDLSILNDLLAAVGSDEVSGL